MTPRPEPVNAAEETVSAPQVQHGDSLDHHLEHVWAIEPTPAPNGVLTSDGVNSIAAHKYKGGTYTALDTFLNPGWEKLTTMLPMWLAPNLVTTIGGCFNLFAYGVTAYYNFSMQGHTPDWVLVLNGVCQIVYFTFDCMDGKQARRTQSSSPLGQLFDHGVDCLGNFSHISISQSIMQQGPRQYWWLQVALMFTFYQAQWEEYYTGVLPHATGNLGVTEVIYGVGMWSILTGLFLKREIFSMELPDALQDFPFPLRSIVLSDIENPLVVRNVLILIWVYMTATLSVLSLIRVSRHVGSTSHAVSAFSKLTTPALVCFVGLFYLPVDELRYPSLCLGLCLCLITIKMIVFSMAQMSYAMLQIDAVPFFAVVAVANFKDGSASKLYPVLAAYYLARLVSWTQSAIFQICTRLNISLFRIKYDKKAQ